MIPANLSAFADHVWQSTLFAGVAALLALALRKNRAHTRYWLWLGASLKFLIPFSLIVSAAGQFEWRSAPAVAPPLSSAIAQVSQPFELTQTAAAAAPAVAAASNVAMPLLLAGWLWGFAAVVSMRGVRLLRLRRAARAATPLPIQAPIEIRSCPTLLEPGVFGIFRPVLLLPEGIGNRLTQSQLGAIIAHELCHVRRRDNLAAAVHMTVEAIFWFHPLVWWIGARMVEERERACDEEVLRLGNEPQAYAEGILNVCKFYLESPLACAAGVTGADLKKRIEAIMTDRISHNLTFARKLLLAAAGSMAVAGPIFVGIVSSTQSRAQSKEALTFEVASIKPSDPDARGVRFELTPGGGMRATNVRLRQLIEWAYDVRSFQISGGPGWLNSEGYDILAKPPRSAEAEDAPGTPPSAEDRKRFQEQLRQRIQALLAERFQLVIHRETKEMPVYALTVAKNGPKFKEASGDQHKVGIRAGRGEIAAESADMNAFINILASRVGRPVLDQTGLKGIYDFKLEWTPEMGEGMMKGGPLDKAEGAPAPDLSGPSIFTALQEQLGLRLEAQKGPAEVIVIDRVEKPTGN